MAYNDGANMIKTSFFNISLTKSSTVTPEDSEADNLPHKPACQLFLRVKDTPLSLQLISVHLS